MQKTKIADLQIIHSTKHSNRTLRQEHEADHSPPSNSTVKKTWIDITTPHMSSRHNAQLVKHMDNFTFTEHSNFYL
jgi:hypothetical protein